MLKSTHLACSRVATRCVPIAADDRTILDRFLSPNHPTPHELLPCPALPPHSPLLCRVVAREPKVMARVLSLPSPPLQTKVCTDCASKLPVTHNTVACSLCRKETSLRHRFAHRAPCDACRLACTRSFTHKDTRAWAVLQTCTLRCTRTFLFSRCHSSLPHTKMDDPAPAPAPAPAHMCHADTSQRHHSTT